MSLLVFCVFHPFLLSPSFFPSEKAERTIRDTKHEKSPWCLIHKYCVTMSSYHKLIPHPRIVAWCIEKSRDARDSRDRSSGIKGPELLYRIVRPHREYRIFKLERNRKELAGMSNTANITSFVALWRPRVVSCRLHGRRCVAFTRRSTIRTSFVKLLP
jgi:hypothetical protein